MAQRLSKGPLNLVMSYTQNGKVGGDGHLAAWSVKATIYDVHLQGDAKTVRDKIAYNVCSSCLHFANAHLSVVES